MKLTKEEKEKQENCVHEWVIVREPLFNRGGWHEDKCKKCGKVNEYDTSD